MRSFKKKHRKSTVVGPNYKDLHKQADRILERWAAGKYVGMPNTDMRCPGEPDNQLPADDLQVQLCHHLAERWKLSDQIIAKRRWGADESKRSILAIARSMGFGRTKVENRVAWIRDCVIESCVKNVNIYP
jgi:hypothetical protein